MDVGGGGNIPILQHTSDFIVFFQGETHLLFVHLNKGIGNIQALGSGNVICHLARAFH